MAPHTINRAALVVIAPALAIGGLLTLTIVFAVIGLPVLALTVPAVVLALQGGVSSRGDASVRSGLVWALGAFSTVLVIGIVSSAVFGGNDLDQPEELVVGILFALWAAAGAAVALQARSAAERSERSPVHPPVPSGA